MAKQKKKGLTLVLLIVGLGALTAGYLVYDKVEKDKAAAEEAAEEETEEAINVLTIDEDSLSKIYYKNNDVGAEVTLVKSDDGTWVLEDNEAAPLDSTSTGNMATLLSSLDATKLVMEDCEDLSQFGLDDPVLTIVATSSDGTENTIQVGEESSIESGYYINVNDGTSIYLVGTTVYSYFATNEVDLIEVADAPSITDTNITRLLIENQDKGNFELTYDEDNPYDDSGSNIYPYTIVQGYDEPVLADSDNITTFFDNYCSLSYAGCVEYESSDLAQYGLDDPAATITLEYYEEEEVSDDSDTTDDTTDSEDSSTDDSSTDDSDTTTTIRTDYTYELAIGDLTEDGSYYYVRDLSSNTVYTMSASSVETMIDFNYYDTVNQYIQLLNVKSVSSIDMIYDGQTVTLSDEVTTTTNDDGEDEDTTTFYLNGTEYDEDTARDLYQVMISPKYDQAIPDGYEGSSGDPLVSFVFHRSSSEYDDIQIDYYEYDDSFYVVNRNGQEYFVADKRSIDEIIDSVLQSVSDLESGNTESTDSSDSTEDTNSTESTVVDGE